MRSVKWLVALVLLVACFIPAQGKIKVTVATTSMFTASGCTGAHVSPLYCPSNPGAAWLRIQGYNSFKAGTVQGLEGYVNEIAESSSPFLNAIDRTKLDSDEYVAYGKADKIALPKAGDYQFKVIADVSAFLYLDGKPLAQPTVLKDSVSDYTGTILGTVAEGGTKLVYVTTVPGLTAGNHTFEFLYFNSGEGYPKFRVQWKTPDDAAIVPIPVSAFGEATSAKQGLRSNSRSATGYTSSSVNRVATPEALIQGARITVTDFRGKTVSVLNQNSSYFDLKAAGLRNGFYLVRIQTAAGSRLALVMVST